MQIRNGDYVTARLQVDDPAPMCEDTVMFRDSDGDCFHIKRSDILSVEPSPLQVRDKVTWGTRFSNWNLVSIGKTEACVELGGKLKLIKIKELVRVE